VPEYRRPLEGTFGRNLRAGTREALSQFVERIGAPARLSPARRDVYARLGIVEARAGRSLDALQAAYRVGARVSWRRLSAAARAAGADADAIALLAESLFAYIDEISAASVEGYARAHAAMAGEQQRLRRRLVLMLVGDEPPDGEALEAAATAAGWPVPGELAVVITRSTDDARLGSRLGSDVIGARMGDLTALLVPGPPTAARRDRLARALRGLPAALGPSVAPADAPRSYARARQGLGLVEAGVVAADRLVAVEDHLAELVLFGDPPLAEELARHRLAPLATLGPAARERLAVTLTAWLRCQGGIVATAEELDVHPQTVRYRLARLRALFGAALDDPDARFELELALRASRQRAR